MAAPGAVGESLGALGAAVLVGAFVVVGGTGVVGALVAVAVDAASGGVEGESLCPLA